MEVKQQNVPAFIIKTQESEKIIAYIEKNAPLLKGRLLIFTEALEAKVVERLKAWKLCYSEVGCEMPIRAKIAKETLLGSESLPKKSAIENSTPHIISEDVRSGTVIDEQGDLVILGRVKDGASIYTKGKLSIFGIIEGDISCDGATLIVKACQRGKILFQGTNIKDRLKGTQLKMVYKEDEEIIIKELE